MFKNSRKIPLICGTLILCVAPLYATNVESSDTRGEKPSITQPETKPTPIPVKPETKPAPMPVKPETKPAPMPVKPETKPAPMPVKPETKPAPMPVKPETKPAPMPVKPETKPAPMPVKPETKPAPMPIKPETKPCPEPIKPATPNCKQTPYYTSYEKILTTMKQDMSNQKSTGNPSSHFMNTMIPHHQAAISMSENILKYTKNDHIKAIANAIIKEQKCDIAKMERLLAKLKDKKCNCTDKETEYVQKYELILNTMMTSLTDAKATCNDDIDFLSQMILHHKGAMAMANNILNYTNHSGVKKMAKNMIKSQEAQVQQMQELLNQLQK